MIKKILLKLPEYYFVAMLFVAGYTPPFTIPFFYIILILILGLQIYFANKVSGLLIGGLVFFFNLLFLGALIFELNEFQEFNEDAKQMLLVGGSIWIMNLMASIAMLYQYGKMKTRSSQRIKFY